MTNAEKLIDAFTRSLALPPEEIVDTLAYSSIPNWDSTAHLVLVAELEAVFGVMLDTDDIIDLSSVAKAREILARHGVAWT